MEELYNMYLEEEWIVDMDLEYGPFDPVDIASLC